MSSGINPCSPEDCQGDGRWFSMHNRYVAETKEREPDVLFVGDSIIQQLAHTDIWEKWFEPMHALNFGIGADTTHNLLWRLQNGEMEHINPKVIVLHVGTNNHTSDAKEVAEGIDSIARYISEKHPQAYIVILSNLPRGQNPNPLREKLQEVNKLVAIQSSKIPQCQVVNIDPGFVQADGTISHHDMYDYLHLTRNGYQRAFEPVYDLLQQLLSE